MTTDQRLQRLDIALCDDHAVVRRALSSVFSRSCGFTIVGEGQSAEDAIVLAERHVPDVMLLDLNMPGGGISAASAIYASLPVVRTVILTSSDDEEAIAGCLVAGAYDVLSKGRAAREILERVREVAAGRAAVTPVLAARLVNTGRYAQPWYQDESIGNELDFFPREQQILTRLAQGLSPEEIAADFGTTPSMVRTYCFNILTKVHSAALTGTL